MPCDVLTKATPYQTSQPFHHLVFLALPANLYFKEREILKSLQCTIDASAKSWFSIYIKMYFLLCTQSETRTSLLSVSSFFAYFLFFTFLFESWTGMIRERVPPKRCRNMLDNVVEQQEHWWNKRRKCGAKF